MSENSTLEYFVEGTSNGKPDLTQFKDNRIKLDVDAKQVKAWEVAVLQTGQFHETMMIFARYLTRGGKLISPGLPDKPIHKLTGGEKSQIRNSAAYEILEMFDLATLQAAATSFVNQANDFGTDPN